MFLDRMLNTPCSVHHSSTAECSTRSLQWMYYICIVLVLVASSRWDLCLENELLGSITGQWCDVFVADWCHSDQLAVGRLCYRRRCCCYPRFSHQLQSDLLLGSVHCCFVRAGTSVPLSVPANGKYCIYCLPNSLQLSKLCLTYTM